MFVPTPSLYQDIQIDIPQYPLITGVHHPISIGSLALFLYALVGIWIMLISFTGWGRAADKILRLPFLPASAACLSGIAVTIFLGGMLNLLHLTYRVVILIMIAVGLLFFWVSRGQQQNNYQWRSLWQQATPLTRIVLTATIFLLIFRVAATIRLGSLNGLDDGPAYLVFPHKMLEAHSFAFDPFSERRVATSLGGGYFLQSFVVSFASLANTAIADRAFGLILLGGILFDLGILFELSIMQIAWLEFLAYLIPQETMNLTFTVLPVALFLGMIWLLWKAFTEENAGAFRYAFLAGIIGGATITLKSTYLPCVGAFLLVLCAISIGRKRISALTLFLVAGLGTLTVMSAWMVAMKLTSGTYLFPVLGRGFDYSTYGLFPSSQKFHFVRTLIKIFLQGAALLVLAWIQMVALKQRKNSLPKDRRAEFSIGILIAAAIAITAMNCASGGDSIWRYNFPQFFSAVLLYCVVAGSLSNDTAKSSIKFHMARVAFGAGLIAMVSMFFYYDIAGRKPQPFRQFRLEWHDYWPSLRASLSGLNLASPDIQNEYRAVESSLPQRSVTLENAAYPFLFNYRSRIIYLADWPGASGPTPGWPFRAGNDLLSKYLANNSVRYLIYDYQYARWMDVEACKALENPDINSEWLRQQWLLTVVSHHQFDHLRTRYASIYDDGKIAVIDLQHPATNASAELATWTLNTSKDEMCSAVMTRYLANPLPLEPK